MIPIRLNVHSPGGPPSSASARDEYIEIHLLLKPDAFETAQNRLNREGRTSRPHLLQRGQQSRVHLLLDDRHHEVPERAGRELVAGRLTLLLPRVAVAVEDAAAQQVEEVGLREGEGKRGEEIESKHCAPRVP